MDDMIFNETYANMFKDVDESAIDKMLENLKQRPDFDIYLKAKIEKAELEIKAKAVKMLDLVYCKQLSLNNILNFPKVFAPSLLIDYWERFKGYIVVLKNTNTKYYLKRANDPCFISLDKNHHIIEEYIYSSLHMGIDNVFLHYAFDPNSKIYYLSIKENIKEEARLESIKKRNEVLDEIRHLLYTK